MNKTVVAGMKRRKRRIQEIFKRQVLVIDWMDMGWLEKMCILNDTWFTV